MAFSYLEYGIEAAPDLHVSVDDIKERSPQPEIHRYQSQIPIHFEYESIVELLRAQLVTVRKRKDKPT